MSALVLLVWAALAKGPKADGAPTASPPEAAPTEAPAAPDAAPTEAPDEASSPAAEAPAAPSPAVAPKAVADALTNELPPAPAAAPPEATPEAPVAAPAPPAGLVPPQLPPSPPEALLEALHEATADRPAPPPVAPAPPPVAPAAPAGDPEDSPPASWSGAWLPQVPRVRAVTAWAWLALVTLVWTLLRGVRAAAAELPEDAPAAQLGRFLGRLGRVVTALILLAVLASVLPAPLAPILPWALVGAALALGGSLIELLRDVVAGAALAGERGLHPGAWAEGPGFAGTVIRRGLRATSVRTADGGRILVPHRVMASSTVSTRPSGGPPCRVFVRLDPDVAPGRVRRAVRRAVAGSPWAAVSDALRVGAMPDQDGRWVVEVPLLAQTYVADVLATLPERVQQELEADHDG